MTKGFPLIELLVVVLIIGLLSSIALPQYTKAVEKARASEAIQMLGDLATAEQIYQMSTGSFTNDLSLLDVQLPGVGSATTSSTTTNKFKLEVTATSPFKAKATRQNNGTDATGDLAYVIWMTIATDGTITRWCGASTDTAAPAASATTASKTCKAIANNSSGLLK
ncbi:MAG: prepilin-type N-terminal cleavage/methylation domain-containing protein [Elusimicrobiaceae bacterium]|nr:prepilin-type N-terminal cleavage/methylation domain-containing protein [Elusimicrobiaceae bacterium]